MTKTTMTVAVLGIGFGLCVSALASHGKAKQSRKGILLVAFGTSDREAKVAFENLERLTRKRFKGTEVRWAFTSRVIRRKLAKQGAVIDSPTVALSKMHDEGFTHVAVQSLHTIGGAEYDEVKETVAKFSKGSESFDQLALGAPLLSSFTELQRLAKTMLKSAPKERKKGEALVLMGHGSEHHYSDLAYVAAAKVFGDLDDCAFVGTVEGHPTMNDVLAECKAAKVKKAYLIPFMSVAGDHAKNDLAGDEENSWKSVLEKNGIDCVPVLKGTAELDAIAEIWIDHLAVALSHLELPRD